MLKKCITEKSEAVSAFMAYVSAYGYVKSVLSEKDEAFKPMVLSLMDLIRSSQRIVYEDEAKVCAYLKTRLMQYSSVKAASKEFLKNPYQEIKEIKDISAEIPSAAGDPQQCFLEAKKLYRAMSWQEYFYVYNRMALPATGGHFSPKVDYCIEKCSGSDYDVLLEFILNKPMGEILLDAINKDKALYGEHPEKSCYMPVSLGMGELGTIKDKLGIVKSKKYNQSNRYSVKNEENLVSLGLGYGRAYGSCLVPEIQSCLQAIRLIKVLNSDDTRMELCRKTYNEDDWDGSDDDENTDDFNSLDGGDILNLFELQTYIQIVKPLREYCNDGNNDLVCFLSSAI